MATVQRLKSEFLRSVKLGTGLAYLLARANPGVDFSAEIIKGALKSYAYDGQVEGSRADYIYNLYYYSKHKAAIRKAVLRGLAEEQTDVWSLAQLFELTLFFANDGYKSSRQALYEQFFNKPMARASWLGANELIDLDGLTGLVHVTRKYG